MVVLKLNKTDKTVKMNKEGDEITTYRCSLKGTDGVINASLTISSDSLITLEGYIPQFVGERRVLSLELLPSERTKDETN